MLKIADFGNIAKIIPPSCAVLAWVWVEFGVIAGRVACLGHRLNKKVGDARISVVDHLR